MELENRQKDRNRQCVCGEETMLILGGMGVSPERKKEKDRQAEKENKRKREDRNWKNQSVTKTGQEDCEWKRKEKTVVFLGRHANGVMVIFLG